VSARKEKRARQPDLPDPAPVLCSGRAFPGRISLLSSRPSALRSRFARPSTGSASEPGYETLPADFFVVEQSAAPGRLGPGSARCASPSGMEMESLIPQRPGQLSNSRAGSPVLFVRRRVRLHALAPQQMRGGGAPSGAPALCSRLDRSAGAQTNPGVLRALIKRARLSALHRGVLSGSRPRFWGRSSPPSASSSQPGPSARRAVPRSRPSAQGHVSPAPAGAAPYSIRRTSPEDAPQRAG
jgi:hypothetical protein